MNKEICYELYARGLEPVHIKNWWVLIGENESSAVLTKGVSRVGNTPQYPRGAIKVFPVFEIEDLAAYSSSTVFYKEFDWWVFRGYDEHGVSVGVGDTEEEAIFAWWLNRFIGGQISVWEDSDYGVQYIHGGIKPTTNLRRTYGHVCGARNENV